jgi:hypothetical protein
VLNQTRFAIGRRGSAPLLSGAPLLGALLLCLSGCPDETSTPGAAATASVSSAPAANASATASAGTKPAAEPQKDAATCDSMNQEQWIENANPRTGITAKRLKDGKLLVGVAVGNRPYLLTFDERGQGSMRRLPLEPKTPISEPPAKGKGVRHLQRVTPTAAGYFVDYRDKYKDGRRRIACGPLKGEPYVVFDGEPILDTDDSGKGRSETPGQTPAASATASAAPVASTTASAAASGFRIPPVKRDVVVDKRREHELRDCRTFADPAGEDVWSVGSELVGKTVDGTRQWYMDFFVLPSAGKGQRILLQRNALGEAPKKLHTLEAPVAHRLADGSFALAGRYKGRMLTWLLDAKKQKKTVLHRYSGGYPSLPRILPDGNEHVLLTSQKIDAERWALRTLRLPNPSELADKLVTVTQGDEDSHAEPTVAQIDGQRWLQYHEGERRKGSVMVMPVDAKLKSIGKPYRVTKEGVSAYESHVFPIDSRKWLLSVYISRPEPGHPAELKSQMLKCSVAP